MSSLYSTIVVDPPWRYKKTRGLSCRGRNPSAEAHYPTMSNTDIAALPVGDLAGATACIFLWVTNPLLFGEGPAGGPAPVEILRAWGFTYRTMLTWLKTGHLGIGWYFRTQTEHVLFGTRGPFRIPSWRREQNVIVAPRRRHSEKPGAFFDLVERVCPPPRLEVFARTQHLGWDSWGDEALCHVDLNVDAMGR